MKYIIPFLLVLIGCSEKENNPQTIINASIKAYGLDQLSGKKVTFDFRDKNYSLERTSDRYVYTRSFEDSLGFVVDKLVNSHEFTRTLSGKLLNVDEEWKAKYANSVNSVLYFVQLPFTLNDPAAIKNYQGIVDIKGEKYHQLEVRFSESDGGKDFEDVFLYWFNTRTNNMDYLAYSYLTEGGGVRFREAINRREIEEVVFQDYINFKPKQKQIPLTEMLDLFKRGELIELSRIENKNIQVVNKEG